MNQPRELIAVVKPLHFDRLTVYSPECFTLLTGPNGLSDSFSYNGLDTRVGKADSSGSHVYRRDGVGVTDPLLNDGSAEYTPGISRTAGTSTLFYGSDRMGSNVMQTDSSENVSSTSQFDAFGNLVASTGSPQGVLGFNGQYGYQTDQDSGFQLLGHRYYDPSTGRFLTRDPIKFGNNWYDYCDNSPTRLLDQEGESWRSIVAGIAMILVGFFHGGGGTPHVYSGPKGSPSDIEMKRPKKVPGGDDGTGSDERKKFWGGVLIGVAVAAVVIIAVAAAPETGGASLVAVGAVVAG